MWSAFNWNIEVDVKWILTGHLRLQTEDAFTVDCYWLLLSGTRSGRQDYASRGLQSTYPSPEGWPVRVGPFLVCIWPNSGCGLFLSLQCWMLYHINGFVAILILTRRINFQGRGSCCTLDVRFCRIKVWFSRLLFSFSFFLARVAIHRLLVLFSSISF